MGGGLAGQVAGLLVERKGALEMRDGAGAVALDAGDVPEQVVGPRQGGGLAALLGDAQPFLAGLNGGCHLTLAAVDQAAGVEQFGGLAGLLLAQACKPRSIQAWACG